MRQPAPSRNGNSSEDRGCRLQQPNIVSSVYRGWAQRVTTMESSLVCGVEKDEKFMGWRANGRWAMTIYNVCLSPPCSFVIHHFRKMTLVVHRLVVDATGSTCIIGNICQPMALLGYCYGFKEERNLLYNLSECYGEIKYIRYKIHVYIYLPFINRLLFFYTLYVCILDTFVLRCMWKTSYIIDRFEGYFFKGCLQNSSFLSSCIISISYIIAFVLHVDNFWVTLSSHGMQFVHSLSMRSLLRSLTNTKVTSQLPTKCRHTIEPLLWSSCFLSFHYFFFLLPVFIRMDNRFRTALQLCRKRIVYL